MSAVRGLPRISSRIIRTERLIRALWLQRVFLRNHASGMMQLFNISRRAGKTQRRRRGAATRVAGEMRRHGAAAICTQQATPPRNNVIGVGKTAFIAASPPSEPDGRN